MGYAKKIIHTGELEVRSVEVGGVILDCKMKQCLSVYP